MELEVTLADLMNQLKLTAKVSDLADVAKKADLLKLEEIVSTHSPEIQQLREDLATQSARIQQLETNLGRQTASMLTRTEPDVFKSRPNKYGGAQLTAPKQDNRKKNLVFEGIRNMTDRETIEFIISICSELSIVAYAKDFESVIRMKR